uniref:Uncharacterized protein n=1 Tax=Arundo donax TaxID=35708 RepID=A0A0A9C0R2_ARUDO
MAGEASGGQKRSSKCWRWRRRLLWFV